MGGDYDTNDDDDGSSSSSVVLVRKCLSLIVVACVSFWCQSVVTEERLIPALNVISDYYGIPDDIAGATLMAAGASSPELLCTLVSLFITHSSLGLGTIVGSEIFNQLIICAGSVYASKPKLHPYNLHPGTTNTTDGNGSSGMITNNAGSKYLVLDKVMVIREVGFYALSIGLLYVALSESQYDYDGNNNSNINAGEEGVEHIYVSFWKASLLFGGYILYVAVCSNMQKCLGCVGYLQQLMLQKDIGSDDGDIQLDNTTNGFISNDATIVESSTNYTLDEGRAGNGSIHYKSFDDPDIHKLSFIYNITTEPVENWEVCTTVSSVHEHHDNDTDIVIANSSNSDYKNHNANHNQTDDNHDIASTSNATIGEKKKKNSIAKVLHKSFKLIGANKLLQRNKCPVEINDVYELTNSEGTHELGCFLWQRSIFYSKAYYGSHFHLRWFSITPQRISSVPNRQEPEKHMIVYPLFDEIHVDEKRLIINIKHPVQGKRDFTLMAPNKAIFDAGVHALQVYMITNRSLRLLGVTNLDDDNNASDGIITSLDKKNKRDNDADPHVELIEFPVHASKIEIGFWIFLYPLRLIMHYTLPDVRHLDRHGDPTKSVGYAYLSTTMCLIWLILGSYTMVASLEALASLMGVPESLIGLTISAAGTSLPAYVASRIAAEKGFGNQAVANVFGSNTFNICVGLGLPWVIYTVGNGPYHDLENDQILESILILAGFLLIFVVLMISTNFVLLKWHADLFIGLYVAYVVFAISQVYIM